MGVCVQVQCNGYLMCGVGTALCLRRRQWPVTNTTPAKAFGLVSSRLVSSAQLAKTRTSQAKAAQRGPPSRGAVDWLFCALAARAAPSLRRAARANVPAFGFVPQGRKSLVSFHTPGIARSLVTAFFDSVCSPISRPPAASLSDHRYSRPQLRPRQSASAVCIAFSGVTGRCNCQSSIAMSTQPLLQTAPGTHIPAHSFRIQSSS